MKQQFLLYATLFFFALTQVNAQSARSEAYADFTAARNATSQSIMGYHYYSETQFTKLAETGERLYRVANQDDVVSRLKDEKRELQSQIETLNIQISALQRTQVVNKSQSDPELKIRNEGVEEGTWSKPMNNVNWFVIGGVVIFLVAFFISQKQKNNS